MKMIGRSISSYWISYGAPQNVILKFPGYSLPEEIVLKIFESGYNSYLIDKNFKFKLKKFIKKLLLKNNIKIRKGLFYLYIRTRFKRGGMFPIFIGKL